MSEAYDYDHEHLKNDGEGAGASQVRANDSSTKNSIPAICERGGYKLLDMKDEGGTITFVIQK